MSALFLIASIADRTIAIDALLVDAVVDIADVVAIPQAPDAVLGLAALRSRVVTVVDTALSLGLRSGSAAVSARGHRAVTTRIDGHGYGFLIDTVDDVAAFDPRPVAVGLPLDAGWRRAATGLIERDDRAIVVLDLAALVPHPVAVVA